MFRWQDTLDMHVYSKNTSQIYACLGSKIPHGKKKEKKKKRKKKQEKEINKCIPSNIEKTSFGLDPS